MGFEEGRDLSEVLSHIVHLPKRLFSPGELISNYHQEVGNLNHSKSPDDLSQCFQTNYHQKQYGIKSQKMNENKITSQQDVPVGKNKKQGPPCLKYITTG